MLPLFEFYEPNLPKIGDGRIGKYEAHRALYRFYASSDDTPTPVCYIALIACRVLCHFGHIWESLVSLERPRYVTARPEASNLQLFVPDA